MSLDLRLTTGAAEPPPSSAARDAAADVVGIDELFPRLYAELRRVAHWQLRAEDTGHTVDTTALVHEAYLRLAHQASACRLTEQQLFALAARAMRRALVDYARQHRAARRGRGVRPIPIDDRFDEQFHASTTGDPDARADELLALDVALSRLERMDARLSKVVELRFYGGLTEAKIADLLGVTERTVRRDWARARDWLYEEVQKELA